ncbi:transcription initiation factor IIE subunit beta isoform X3 [Ornithorhynchus anatinus]|uniref:transcription initiation factor IIE subunit beta isoform X3 n=1 Tax=Ornithorhynchus anatinus TaxID=9258 RepID=UPI0010A7902F|nr:transcription initiation factor IIE subunit beta isoform X3 [Ornithorhynchus anatinus]
MINNLLRKPVSAPRSPEAPPDECDPRRQDPGSQTPRTTLLTHAWHQQRRGTMDPSLLRERELFKKRALSTPAVEKRPAPSSEPSSAKKKKAKLEQAGASGSKQNSDHSNGSFNLKALSGGSGYKFGVLAKIVNYMKTRHQRGDTHPLTLEEILDETQHLDIGLKQKQWLMSEALGDQIIFVTRPDKKKILFFNDKSCQFTVDEEFQKLWRSIPVDSMDEEKIEEYLKRQGISSMQESGPKKMAPIQRRKKPASQKKRRFKTHNDHLAGVLQDYSDVIPGKQ